MDKRIFLNEHTGIDVEDGRRDVKWLLFSLRRAVPAARRVVVGVAAGADPCSL